MTGCSSLGEQHLRAILSEYIGHYHTGRSQGHGMDLRAPDDAEHSLPRPGHPDQRRTTAGLNNEYWQAA
jgi:hypothetical protein